MNFNLNFSVQRVTTITNALRQAINLSSDEEEKKLAEEALREVESQVPVKPKEGIE